MSYLFNQWIMSFKNDKARVVEDETISLYESIFCNIVDEKVMDYLVKINALDEIKYYFNMVETIISQQKSIGLDDVVNNLSDIIKKKT